MRWLLAGLLASLISSYAVVGQEATPAIDELTAPEGASAYAERTFMAGGLELFDALALWFSMVRFETNDLAGSGLPDMVDQLPRVLDIRDLKPASGPKVADQSEAYIGTLFVEDEPLAEDGIGIGILVVRDDHDVHLWYAISLATNPLRPLIDIAENWFDESHAESSEPLDALPGLQDIPPGYVLDNEEQEFASEVTPIATPA